jgi:outer membrane receptor for ferric coprogen and ferric-rhodotorulic acid
MMSKGGVQSDSLLPSNGAIATNCSLESVFSLTTVITVMMTLTVTELEQLSRQQNDTVTMHTTTTKNNMRHMQRRIPQMILVLTISFTMNKGPIIPKKDEIIAYC